MAILRIHLPKIRKLRHCRIVEDLAAKTEGFSGAELAALCRAAGLNAIKRGLAKGTPARRLVVSAQDLRQALEAAQAQRVAGGNLI